MLWGQRSLKHWTHYSFFIRSIWSVRCSAVCAASSLPLHGGADVWFSSFFWLFGCVQYSPAPRRQKKTRLDGRSLPGLLDNRLTWLGGFSAPDLRAVSPGWSGAAPVLHEGLFSTLLFKLYTTDWDTEDLWSACGDDTVQMMVAGLLLFPKNAWGGRLTNKNTTWLEKLLKKNGLSAA